MSERANYVLLQVREGNYRQQTLIQRTWMLLLIIVVGGGLMIASLCMSASGIYNQMLYPRSMRNEVFPQLAIERAFVYANTSAAVWNDISTSVPKSSALPEQLRLVCYYSFPSDGLRNVLTPENIDPQLCTHINLGFGSVRNNSVFLTDSQIAVSQSIIQLKKQNKELKVLISVGGAGNKGGFDVMVSDHANRKAFISSVDLLIKKYKFDGIDLDWEFPDANKRQHVQFTQLLGEIRKEINRQEKHKYLLSIAVPAPTFLADIYDPLYINKFVDYVNLMSYDYHFYTTLTPFTGINSPLYASSIEHGYFTTLNINYSANYWVSKGIDRDKVVIGLPTYGHTFQLFNANNNVVGAPAKGYGNLGSNGFVAYADTCWFLTNNRITPNFDEDYKSPFATKQREWISYDDQTSLTFKAEYVKNNGFGGAMVYSLNSDDHKGYCKTFRGNAVRFPLTNTIKAVFRDTIL